MLCLRNILASTESDRIQKFLPFHISKLFFGSFANFIAEDEEQFGQRTGNY